jgi:hypothetical protein
MNWLSASTPQGRTRLLCLAAALWFALGPGLKVLVAHAFGKHIEIVVCTGAGLKKISVPVSSDKSSHTEAAVKHCSNAPLALILPSFGLAPHLDYATPQTSETWQTASTPHEKRDWALNGWPPPGRAPPVLI